MRTSTRYFLYLTLLHLVIGGLAYWLLREQLHWLLPVELILLVSLYVGWRFYGAFLAPTRLIERGEASLKDGDFTGKFMPTGSPEVDRLVKLYNDMVENLRRERTEKQERQYLLDKLLSSAELGLILLDFDGKVDTINGWARQRLNLSKNMVGQSAEVLNTILGVDLTALPYEKPKMLTYAGDRRLRVEKGRFIDRGFERTFFIVHDITSDLLAAEKKAYGKVIRMMAHEVNNSVGATNSMLASLLDAAREQEPDFPTLAREYLPLTIERGDKMNKFMRNFASVIRLPAARKERIDLTESLRRLGLLFTPTFKEAGIELVYPGPDAPILFASADPAQMEQLIINALTNARESLDGRAGTVRLELTDRPRGFVIADNGPGISPDVADRIFTPFFSTKPTGQGIGLTLSRDILEGHAARYSLRTDADGWTRFRVELP